MRSWQRVGLGAPPLGKDVRGPSPGAKVLY